MNLYLFLALLIIVLLIFVAIYFYQQYSLKKANKLKEEKNKLENLQVDKALIEGRKLTLSGKSIVEYQKIESTYNDLINNKFTGIDEQFNSISNDTKGLNFFRTFKEMRNLSALVDESKKSVNKINSGIKDLQLKDEEQQKKSHLLKQKYNDLRKTFLSNEQNFSLSDEYITEYLKNLSNDFDSLYNNIDKGDLITAESISAGVEKDINKLETAINKVPDLTVQINETIPSNVNELKNGIEQLKEQKFAFTFNPTSFFDDIQKKLNDSKGYISQIDVPSTQKTVDEINKDLDEKFENVDLEWSSKKESEKRFDSLNDSLRILRSKKKNIEIELDRVSQRFEVSSNQTKEIGDLSTEIDNVSEYISTLKKQLNNGLLPHSEGLKAQEDILNEEKKINDHETSISNSLSSMDKQFFEINNKLSNIQNDFNNTKKMLDSSNLPGINSNFKSLYLKTLSNLKDSEDYLNRSKVNFSELKTKVNGSSDDVSNFKKQSIALVQNKNISNAMIRRLGRFQQFPGVTDSIDQASEMYRNFDYIGAREISSRALGAVDREGRQMILEQYTSES